LATLTKAFRSDPSGVPALLARLCALSENTNPKEPFFFGRPTGLPEKKRIPHVVFWKRVVRRETGGPALSKTAGVVVKYIISQQLNRTTCIDR
jgi:hypothetical protein